MTHDRSGEGPHTLTGTIFFGLEGRWLVGYPRGAPGAFGVQKLCAPYLGEKKTRLLVMVQCRVSCKCTLQSEAYLEIEEGRKELNRYTHS